MMTFTVKEAYALHEAMFNHSNSKKTIKGKVGLAFSYNYRLLHEALSEFISRRDDIIRKYADKIDDKTREMYENENKAIPITITDPNNLAMANKEISEFEDLKIELPIMEISVDDILKNEEMDSSDMDLVIWMTKEFISDKKKIKAN